MLIIYFVRDVSIKGDYILARGFIPLNTSFIAFKRLR
jgi:hypothetical protein